MRRTILSLVGALLIAFVIVGVYAYIRLRPPSTYQAAGFVSQATAGSRLHVPAGFHVGVFAQGLGSPRFMAVGPDGTLYVAVPSSGSVLALPDPQHTGVATGVITVTSGLPVVTSLSFYQGVLYAGIEDGVVKMTLNAQHQATSRQQIISDIPKLGAHVTRTVLVSSDGHIFLSIGSDCNICVETSTLRASVWEWNLDGTGGHRYASGLRNAVGLAFNPWTGQLWDTSNGRDYLGNNIPPDTIDAEFQGANFGWPYCDAGYIVDPTVGHPGSCAGVVQPAVKVQAHSAPLGLVFGQALQAPAEWQNALYVAFHGSWNRSVPTGYKVVMIPLKNGAVAGPPQDFLTGFINSSGDYWGRPAGVAIGADGALYVSDDTGGRIFRITWTGNLTP